VFVPKLERYCRLDSDFAYLPCQWDFALHRDAARYFVAFFREQFDRTLKLAYEQAKSDGHDGPALSKRIERCRREFGQYLDEMLTTPEIYDRPTILTLDYVRDGILRSAGFPDPYYEAKHHDNETVISLLPELCRDIDAHPEPTRLSAVIQGALAGNIFDMGVAATAKRMLDKSLSFIQTRDNLPAHPWAVDDFDVLKRRFLNGPPHRKAAIFVDNAGADFILGMLPLARYLAQRGTHVVMVGNELPTLNDMTLRDMREIWSEVLAAEPSFGQLPITLISSGVGEPLLDLRRISPRLNAASADADLVILEGMGRALESNFFTRFDCDALKIAMIKDQYLADWLDAKLYDVVCRFEPKRA
jgi:type II pantothenate kinase